MTVLYHIKDSDHPVTVIKEIEKDEQEAIKKFSELFSLYEGVSFAFSNYHNAKVDNERFKKSLETFNSKASLGEVQRMSVYPITTEIIFLNTFLDNTKNFGSIIKSKKIHLGYFQTVVEGAVAYNNYIIGNNLEGFILNKIPEVQK